MTSGVIRVACAVIVRGGKVFAARRSSRSRHPLQWEFPGGKVEAGESDEECLHRELMEELGLKVKVLKRLPEFRHAYPAFDIILIPFLCALDGGKVVLHEHQETAWVDKAGSARLDWTRADIPLMDYVRGQFL
jgi:8-oxo-dGTP diphosphatase